jgi:hypothetical protein
MDAALLPDALACSASAEDADLIAKAIARRPCPFLQGGVHANVDKASKLMTDEARQYRPG